MQVAAATPQAAGRLLEICPDMSILLAAVALRKGILRSVCLYLDGNVAEVGNFNNSWDLVVLGIVTSNKGRVTDVPSSDRRVVDSCMTLTTSQPRSPRSSAMSSAGALISRWRITALMGFSDFEKE
jgi:hypothetical protein